MKLYFKSCIWILLIVGILLGVSYIYLTYPMESPVNDVLSSNNYYIAHATGEIDGNTYLNCKESLLQSLDNGYKYIEVDLGLTTDSKLVCIHDWTLFHKITTKDNNIKNNSISEDEFRQRKILDKYTPLTLENVIQIRNNHPFIIVTDKISDTRILNQYF